MGLGNEKSPFFFKTVLVSLARSMPLVSKFVSLQLLKLFITSRTQRVHPQDSGWDLLTVAYP